VKVFEHWILVKADSKEEAKTHIKSFLDKYELLYYDKIEFSEILRGDDIKFFDTLFSLMKINKNIIESFINDLEEEGYKTLRDLKDLPQGYLSKILHTLTHLLDGFMGIDSYFYNLIEDSHFVSKKEIYAIQREPEKYYLVKIKGYSEVSEPLFEWLKPLMKKEKDNK
jgi:hypothetical protein